MIFMSQPNGTNSCRGLNGNTKPDNDEQMLSSNREEEEEQDSSEKNHEEEQDSSANLGNDQIADQRSNSESRETEVGQLDE